MKNHKLFAGVLWLLLAAAVAQPVSADDYNYLTLQYEGVQQSVVLSTLKKITFSGGKMQVATANETLSYDLNTMEKMFFSATATAVTTPSASRTELAYDRATQTVHVGEAGKGATLNVYFVNGSLALRAPVAAEGATVSLSALPKGLYVIKLNGQTLKIMR